MESITHAPGQNASTTKIRRASRLSSEPVSDQIRGFHADPRRALFATSPTGEDQEPNTLLLEDATLAHGFVLLPKLILYARNLSRDAKLLYAVLLGYAWQEQRCFPGYQRLCDDMNASENMVRKYMRELEAVHLLSQRRRGQGRTNLYLLHHLRTAKIAVQEQHKSAVLEPQESEDNEETVKKQTQQEQSGIRNSKGPLTSNKAPRNERLFTQAPGVSTTKDNDLKSFAGRKTEALSVAAASPAALSNEASGKAKEQRKTESAKAHQLTAERGNPPAWLPGYMVDFSREFHDEAATASNITRATHLFERARMDPDAFIAQTYAARRITQGRTNIQKQSKVGKNAALPAGVPNRMPYFFRVLEDLLGVNRKKHSEARDEPAEAGLTTVSKGKVACVEARAEAENTAGPLAQAGLAEEAAHEEVRSGSGQEKSLPAASGDSPTAPEPASSWPEETDARGLAQEDPYDLEQRVLREEAQRYVGVPVNPHARQIWQSALERIRPNISQSAFTTWFSGTSGLALEDETLLVRVGSNFSRQHLEQRFSDLIERAVSEQRGTETETRLIVIPDALEEG